MSDEIISESIQTVAGLVKVLLTVDQDLDIRISASESGAETIKSISVTDWRDDERLVLISGNS